MNIQPNAKKKKKKKSTSYLKSILPLDTIDSIFVITFGMLMCADFTHMNWMNQIDVLMNANHIQHIKFITKLILEI